MATKTLLILYNADASIMGKLKYSYRKLTTSKDCTPACAACDITHGGLHLDETSEWKRVKGEVAEKGGMEVKQLHRDELGEAVSFLLFLFGLLLSRFSSWNEPRLTLRAFLPSCG